MIHDTYLKATCSNVRFIFLVVFIGMLSDTFYRPPAPVLFLQTFFKIYTNTIPHCFIFLSTPHANANAHT